MPNTVVRSWWQSAAVAAGGLLVAGRLLADGLAVVAGAELLAFTAVALLVSPMVFPRSIGAVEAQRRSAIDGRPVLYWRPGCRYCVRLRFRLGRHARRMHWVNIWRDPAGAAAVSAITGGDETVPTMVLGGKPVVNPDPDWLRGRLAGS